MPVTITYDNTSALNSMDNLAMGVSSVLTSYTSGVYVNSIIVLTVLNNLILNGTKLECAIGDLENTIIDLFVNISGINLLISTEIMCFVFPFPLAAGMQCTA